jgi:hypothetical protein
MAFAGADVRYAFILNVATHEERRREGHFRALLEHTLARLRTAGISFVVTHGPAHLYRARGFGVFTHHCGIFISPEAIDRALGPWSDCGELQRIHIEKHRAIHEDLMLVSEVTARTYPESRAALQAAASAARARGKRRILFEHPPAPSYGSRYPAYASLDSPFTSLARACGAEVRIQGACPEAGTVAHADWIRVVDAERFLAEASRCVRPGSPIRDATISFETEAGSATIESNDGRLTVLGRSVPGLPAHRWPSRALAQVVTGYQRCDAVATLLGDCMPLAAVALLDTLFPQRWRLSRNEDWVFRS